MFEINAAAMPDPETFKLVEYARRWKRIWMINVLTIREAPNYSVDRVTGIQIPWNSYLKLASQLVFTEQKLIVYNYIGAEWRLL